jgi:hypothetical protein
MRTIIIEQEVYKCSERVYKLLVKKSQECYQNYKKEDELFEFIEELKPKFRFIGTTDFHFQL